jgi:Transcription factor WhiB
MPDLFRHVVSDEIGEAGELLELLIHGRPKWWRQAACRDHPELSWFPDRHVSSRPAQRICESCPVMWPCREWSLAQPAALAGVWGGLNADQRRRMRGESLT